MILGLDWLRSHNPTINWKTLQLRFTDDCRGYCLPYDATEHDFTAPKASERLNATAATAEPTGSRDRQPRRNGLRVRWADEVEKEERARQRRSRKQREYRQRQRLRNYTAKRGGNTVPRWTQAPPGMRGVLVPDAKGTSPTPARRVAGIRLPPVVHRPSRRTAVGEDWSNHTVNTDDMTLLGATSFCFLARQKGVKVTRTTWAELERHEKRAENVKIPNLPEETFRRLVLGKGDPEEYKTLLPEATYDFIDAIFTPGDSLHRITERDAEAFLEKASKPMLTEKQIKERLPKKYHNLIAAFLPQDARQLPPHRAYDHRIELIPGSKLPYAKNRPFSPLELKVIKKWLDKELAKGFIRPSQSDVASPILLVVKPGGGVRICVDFRGINNVTLKSRYPIPLIKETLDAICKAKVFTKLDVIAAFNRVRVTEGHEWLTAFITRFGLYESLVTPFGLQGAPSTFQHYVNDMLFDILNRCATAYLDDILIYSEDPREHEAQVRKVLQRLIKAGLQADISKCEFNTTRTKYLGLIITPGGIEIDPEKVRAVNEWLPPTTKRHLQRFLGFANFYRRFINGFSAVARPLYDLTAKSEQWK